MSKHIDYDTSDEKIETEIEDTTSMVEAVETADADTADDEYELSVWERIYLNLKKNWKNYATGMAIVVALLFFAGFYSNNNAISNIPNTGRDAEIAVTPPPSASAPMQESVQTAPPTDEPIVEEVPSDNTNTSAHDAGVRAGEAYNEVKDGFIDFFTGVDEATGATDWLTEKFTNGVMHISDWVGVQMTDTENLDPADITPTE